MMRKRDFDALKYVLQEDDHGHHDSTKGSGASKPALLKSCQRCLVQVLSLTLT